MFFDSYLAGGKSTRSSQTGVLVFINKAPIYCYGNIWATVEASTFVAEFCAMKSGVEMFEALRYKLRMFGVPIDGSANVFCDNKAIYKNTITLKYVLKKKHNYIAYHRCREAVAANTIIFDKQENDKNPPDMFTKIIKEARRRFLLDKFTY